MVLHPELGGALLVAAALLVWPPRGRVVPASLPPRTDAAGRATGPCATTDGGTGLPTPIVLELVCAALEAGLPTGSALRAALAVTGGDPDGLALLAAAPGRRTAGASPQWAPMARALDLADRTGASAAVLLRSAAADERARRRAAVRLASGRLGVRLVLPLGLTVLPAFVLLGVAPVVLGLAEQVLSAP